eukprot:362412-Chlamydomonas_euryale.AAC.3
MTWITPRRMTWITPRRLPFKHDLLHRLQTASRFCRTCFAAPLCRTADLPQQCRARVGSNLPMPRSVTTYVRLPWMAMQVKDDDTVTLRERDSMGQVRVPVPEIASVVRDLVFSLTSWEAVKAKYPAQAAPAADE